MPPPASVDALLGPLRAAAPFPCCSMFCWDGHVYKCANGGFRCKEGAGRCVSTSTYPHLPGSWDRYSCLNNK